MGELIRYGAFFFCSATLLALLLLGAWRLARSGRQSRWRRRAANAGLALAVLLGPLVAAEGYFLFCVDVTDGALATLTSRRWAERHLPKPRGTPRGRLVGDAQTLPGRRLTVAVIGDSITFGQGVADDRDLYPSLLERNLRRRGVAADVFNLSSPGWNLFEEKDALRGLYDEGLPIDLVVLGFCLNDMGQYVRSAAGFREDIARLSTPPAALAPLVEHSFVFSLLYVRLAYLGSPAIRQSWNAVAAAYEDPKAFLALAVDLESFKSLAQSHGSRLVVVTFPDTSLAWERYPYRDFHRKIDAFWRLAGVPHVDLLPVFERHLPKSLRASFLDSHPNELGHRLAAEALAEALAAALGLPAGAPPG